MPAERERVLIIIRRGEEMCIYKIMFLSIDLEYKEIKIIVYRIYLA